MAKIDEIPAYSSQTGKSYENWQALVEAEANEWLAVAIVASPKKSWPWVKGPFATKREATNAKNRLRSQFKKSGRDHAAVTATFFVRPLWKP